MGLMAIVNLVSIIGLSNIAFAVMKDYIQQKRAGLKPVFKPENLEINLFGIESWGREDKISKNINNLNQHFFSPSFRVMRERSVFKRTTFQI